MCGRYGLRVNFQTLAKLLRAEPVADVEWGPDYNIAPTDQAPVLLPAPDTRALPELALFRWGLVPFWAKGPREGAKMINARSDGVATKPAFREALAARRLLVPASGWYEWTPAGPDTADRKPDPHWIHALPEAPEQLSMFAGLWAKWKDPASGDTLRTFSIITTDAADTTRVIHDRMPVVLDAAAQARWLDPRTSTADAQALLVPYEGTLAHRRVRKEVNSVRSDGPQLIEPLEPPAQTRLAL